MSTDPSHPPLFTHDGQTPATTHTVFLALGTNLGDRPGNLGAALQHLRAVVEIERISSIYETEPVGYLDQPRFLNLVCCGKTVLTAQSLLNYAKEIESARGRKTSFRNGPRPIDIDLLFYDDLQLEQEQLTIPHPRMRERAFVLAPLAEIAPAMIDPTSGKTSQELLDAVSQEGIIRLAAELKISLTSDSQSG
jgi:2-amino-4-hydroxy-6-hydroxymethyldihydropteridine diphosphokinase